ncbi:MAG: hypothetical protein R3B67_12855 [Phycisphaerales bacterium]
MMSLASLAILGVLLLDPVTIEIDRKPAVVGEVVRTGPQGISVRLTADQPAQDIAWYELRGGELPDGVPRQFEQVASQAWRAHTRLMRGDAAGAMADYASMSQQYIWQAGRQSLDVCDGYAKCLILSGHRARAIEPMLAWYLAAQGQDALSPDVDQGLRLRRDLPPVFSGDDLGLQLDPVPVDAQADDRTKLIRAYYELVLAPEFDRQSVIDSIEALQRSIRARDPGLILLEQACFAQAHPDPTQRQSARDALLRRTQTQPDSWTEVWARLALGAALIRDDDPLMHDRGVVQLIHVIVRLSTIDPDLTLLAAQIAREHLEATDRAQWGAQLVHDARRNIAGLNQSAERRETPNDE